MSQWPLKSFQMHKISSYFSTSGDCFRSWARKVYICELQYSDSNHVYQLDTGYLYDEWVNWLRIQVVNNNRYQPKELYVFRFFSSSFTNGKLLSYLGAFVEYMSSVKGLVFALYQLISWIVGSVEWNFWHSLTHSETLRTKCWKEKKREKLLSCVIKTQSA